MVIETTDVLLPRHCCANRRDSKYRNSILGAEMTSIPWNFYTCEVNLILPMISDTANDL